MSWKEKLKKEVLDWLDAIVFALVVVTVLNMFFFQAFKIPSSSMESSLYTGDRLFVEKLTYGPRVPQHPLTIPFTHNVIGSKKSYSEAWTVRYHRMRGFREVRRGDVIVFNFPHGDTVLMRAPAQDYYQACRLYGRDAMVQGYGPLMVHPYDKADHYVKRCVACPGDTLEVRDGYVWVNGTMEELRPGLQFSYTVTVTSGSRIATRVLQDLGINTSECYFSSALPGYPEMFLTADQAAALEKTRGVMSVVRNCDTEPAESDSLLIFPFNGIGWTRDNFGPLVMPAKGATVDLTLESLPFYHRIISVYEGHSLEVKDGEIYIDGNLSSQYTFAGDYYFAMGDNRHNSLDSRYWGFVPETHMVGRPLVIWLSTDDSKSFPENIRWKRFLKFRF